MRVPAAEVPFGALRQRFDPSAAEGVPAHVTVLFPFMPPQWVTPAVLAQLQEACAGVPAFDFRLAGVRRWPLTAWLAPEPSQPFVELTRAVVARFPACPPYGGRHPQIVPHLTLADGSEDGAAQAEREARALLHSAGALQARCVEVELIENSAGRWRTMHRIALGRPPDAAA